MDIEYDTGNTETQNILLHDNDIFRNHDEYNYSENDMYKDSDDDNDDEQFFFKDGDKSDQELESNYNVQDEDTSDDDFCCTEIKSPGGSKTAFWLPKVDEAVQPILGMGFDTLNEGIDFYEEYSKKAGFDTRLGSTKSPKGVLRYKYVICNKAGKSDTKHEYEVNGKKSTRKRKHPSKMVDCPASVGFKLNSETGKWCILSFVDMHNHCLFTKATVHMSRHRRQLDFYDKSIIQQLSTSNFGATKAHSFVTGMKGGYHKQGPKKIDFKNFSRDLNCYVGSGDAHMVVNMLKLRRKNLPNFSFKCLTEDNMLRGLFWADGIAKRNYTEFSDIISFDATFRTNKYNMIFVPFTGIDNHKRCITFGAALLAQETVEYYTWLLETFLEAFGKQPRVVVTDQDAAIGKAVETVFTQTTHRLCMWHIVKKLNDKVAPSILNETDFRKRLQSLIWSSCNTPEVFESKWEALIGEFELQGNKWLKKMYEKRRSWIPAYFKDVPLSGLMRTTSRSESENYFFQSFMSRKSNLLMFITKFDSAMDKQRNIQASSDFDSVSKKPAIQTQLSFEVQAANFYTHAIFKIFQKEIHDAVWSCSPGQSDSFGDHDICVVLEQVIGDSRENRSLFSKRVSDESKSINMRELQYQVTVYPSAESFQCTCMLFEHYGILCRHILCIMKKGFMKNIPSKYLIRRWRKDIIRPEDLQKNMSIANGIGGSHRQVQDAYSVISDCLRIVAHDGDAMAKYIQWQKEILMKIQANPPEKDTRSRDEVLGSYVGVLKPDKVVIQNPINLRNKGCGSGGKRLKGKRELAREKASGRTCHYCNKKISPSEKHDARNCPAKKKDDKLQKLANKESTSHSIDN